MTNVLRIAHLRIAHHVCNPEVGKREIHQCLFRERRVLFLRGLPKDAEIGRTNWKPGHQGKL